MYTVDKSPKRNRFWMLFLICFILLFILIFNNHTISFAGGDRWTPTPFPSFCPTFTTPAGIVVCNIVNVSVNSQQEQETQTSSVLTPSLPTITASQPISQTNMTSTVLFTPSPQTTPTQSVPQEDTLTSKTNTPTESPPNTPENWLKLTEIILGFIATIASALLSSSVLVALSSRGKAGAASKENSQFNNLPDWKLISIFFIGMLLFFIFGILLVTKGLSTGTTDLTQNQELVTLPGGSTHSPYSTAPDFLGLFILTSTRDLENNIESTKLLIQIFIIIFAASVVFISFIIFQLIKNQRQNQERMDDLYMTIIKPYEKFDLANELTQIKQMLKDKLINKHEYDKLRKRIMRNHYNSLGITERHESSSKKSS